MKKIWLVTVTLFALLVALNSYVLACDKGCTPGFWKQQQHFDQWNGYVPTQTLQDVFGCGGDTTLLAALENGGGGEDALKRHAVAALLNAAAFPCFDIPLKNVISGFCDGLEAPPYWMEIRKDQFEVQNDQYCPLK